MGFVVAIDGPAGSGKGEIAQRLGAALGLPVLDTGLLYRAVGAAVLALAGDPDDGTAAAALAAGVDLATLGSPALRTIAAGEAASRVAVHGKVRAALLEVQRSFAGREPGAILDGRDIGTVIVPDAAAKLFVTASLDARARRRRAQLAGLCELVELDDVRADPAPGRARRGPRGRSPAAGGRRLLARHHRSRYRRRLRTGPTHRRGGARALGAIPGRLIHPRRFPIDPRNRRADIRLP